MSEYLIQDTTLDAIADAINAKTGGSSAMTPAEMVTAIGSISGGGGGWELIAEATTDEDVEAFRVDIPAAKQNMAAYIVEYDCGFVGGAKFPCPRLNSITHGSPYTSQARSVNYYIGIAKGVTGYRMVISNVGGTSPGQNVAAALYVEYVAMVGYYAGDLVATGSTIKVYGIGEPT